VRPNSTRAVSRKARTEASVPGAVRGREAKPTYGRGREVVYRPLCTRCRRARMADADDGRLEVILAGG
jgi:hypothetical protein